MAGRIARRSVELVKERADIVELVEARSPGGVRKAGARFVARCPFHDERTPSFSIDPVDKLYYCFGCGVGGDVIRFIQELDGLQFDEAVEQLADRYGVELEREELAPGEAQALERRRRLETLLDETASFYERYLASSEEAQPARSYLAERGIGAEAIEAFRLGFAPEAWERVTRGARSKGYSPDELFEAGIASRGQRGPIDRFRGRIIFPLADARGRVRGFGARVMPGGEGPKYLNSPESELFHKGSTLYGLHLARAAIAKRGRAIVVEGYTDVIMLHQAGFTETVAAMGTSLTAEQLSELKRLAGRLVLCFDADAAGQDAALRGMRLAEQQGFTVKVAALPAGKDPADLLADGPEAFDEALSRAESVLSFRIGRVLAGLERDGADEVYAAAQGVLAQAPPTPDRAEQVRRVASALRLDADLQARLVPRGRAAAAAGVQGGEPRLRKRLDRERSLEMELVGVAIAEPATGGPMLEAAAREGMILDPDLLALLDWARARIAGTPSEPPAGLERQAAEVAARAAGYAEVGAPTPAEAEEVRQEAVKQVYLSLQLRRIEDRVAALKERLDQDDNLQEGQRELAELHRAAGAIKERLRAGTG